MTVPLVTTKLLIKDCLKVFLFVLISKSQIEKKLFKVNVLKKLSNLISVVVLRERINIIRTGNNIKIDKTATSSDLVLLLTTTASATPVTKNFISPINGTLYVSLTVDDDGGNAVFDNISIKKLNGNPGLTSGGVTFSSDTP